MICPKCGREIRDGLTFCPGCLTEFDLVRIGPDVDDLTGAYRPFDQVYNIVPRKKWYEKTWVRAAGVACCIALALIIARPWQSGDYSSGVESIMSENYAQASQSLAGVTKRDGEALLEYSRLQEEIDSYKGRPEAFLTKLEAIDGIQNDEVSKQYEEACRQTEMAGEAQEEISAIETSEVSADDADQLDSIGDMMGKLKKRYLNIIDTRQYDSACETVRNIQDKTDIGQAILAIDDIGEVSLSSGEEIERARQDYDDLSDAEKKKVVNYGALTSAEEKLDSLEREKASKEKEEQERQASIEKEEQERQASIEKAEQESREAEQAGSDRTVYITNTGRKYHNSGCPSLSQSKYPISLSEAKDQGYEPCGRCRP